jgi:hypothetical protein
MVCAFSQIPDGYGSGRGYGRGMGGRMMAGRGFGNALSFFCNNKELLEFRPLGYILIS